jgi:hypothetical protein
MASQKNRALKSVAGLVTLLGAITALITAVAGPDGFPQLIAAFRGKGGEPTITPTTPTQSPGGENFKVDGDKNIIIGGSNNSTGPIQQIEHQGTSIN